MSQFQQIVKNSQNYDDRSIRYRTHQTKTLPCLVFTCFKEVFLEPHDEIEGEVEVAKVGQGGDHPSVDGDQVVGAEVHRGQGGVV